MKLDFSGFQASFPKLDTAILPEQAAAKAHNIYNNQGNLQPLLNPKPYRSVTKPGDQLTIYRFAPIPGDPDSGFLFSWPIVVDISKGPVAGNNQELTYWTGDGYPKFTDNSLATGDGELPKLSYRLGIPDTNLAPVAKVADKPKPVAEEEEKPPDQRLLETRDYVVTFCSTLGSLTMEGPPSNASNIVEVSTSQQVELTHIPSPPSGNYKWTSKNLYRRLQTTGATSFHLVATLDPNADTFTDDIETKLIPGDTLVSQTWYPPPETMHSLVVLSNGLCFGANDNDICVSEPYLPHAWNPSNRYPVAHKIVGLGVADNNVVALTEKNPYILMGSNASAMTTTELTLNQGCLSKRGIVSGNFGCIYPSPDGLVLVSGGGSSLMTEQLFTRKQWRELNPSSMIGATHDDRLVMAYTKVDGTQGSFILQPRDPNAGVIFSDVTFCAAYHDPLLDSLMVFIPGIGLALWNEGYPIAYTWLSRQFILPVPATFTACRVEADSYDDTNVTLIAKDRKYESFIPSRTPVRYPSGYADHWFQLQVQGTDTIRRIVVGESVSELQ